MEEAQKAVVVLQDLDTAMYTAPPEPAAGLSGFEMQASSVEVSRCAERVCCVSLLVSLSCCCCCEKGEVSSSPLFQFTLLLRCFFCDFWVNIVLTFVFPLRFCWRAGFAALRKTTPVRFCCSLARSLVPFFFFTSSPFFFRQSEPFFQRTTVVPSLNQTRPDEKNLWWFLPHSPSPPLRPPSPVPPETINTNTPPAAGNTGL